MNEPTTKHLPSSSQVTRKDEMKQKPRWPWWPWRKKPDEISERRKNVLRKRLKAVRDIKSDNTIVKKGKYPFKGKNLSRADVVFLLSVLDDEHEPVIGGDPTQCKRKGLDLRGAKLPKVDLSGLQLDHIFAGLTEEEWFIATPKQCKMAVSNFDDANFTDATLEGATFSHAHLRRANFTRASLKNADLFGADLREASFYKTNLDGTNLHNANLESAKVGMTEFKQASVDKEVSKVVVEERTVVPPWGVRENKIPFLPARLYHEYKAPRWLKGFGKLLMIPLLIALITILATHPFDNISQKIQAKQKELEMKDNLIVRMSNTVANALAELELIQFDQESNDVNVALKNYDDGYRNLLVNGSEIEAELSSYFPGGQSCTNMSNFIPKGSEGYNDVVLAWDSYYRVVINNFYDLESNTNMKYRSDDIYWIKYVFSNYDIEGYSFIVDQKPVDWGKINKFSYIKKYNNRPELVKAGDGSSADDDVWNNLINIIDGYKSIIGQCVLSLNIPALSVPMI
jgi:hypothetical protein